MTKYTTLADLYLEKLGVTCMKSYPPIPATVFLSKEQLAIWTELNNLDKNIQINTSIEELGELANCGLTSTADGVVISSPNNINLTNIPGLNITQSDISSISSRSGGTRRSRSARKHKSRHATPQPMVRRTYKSRKIMPMEMRIKI